MSGLYGLRKTVVMFLASKNSLTMREQCGRALSHCHKTSLAETASISQVSCVANEVDDALAVHSFSRRECSYREFLAWSESHEEHDFLGGDLATGNLWTGLVFLQPASVLLLRGKHFQVKPRLVLHDKLVAE